MSATGRIRQLIAAVADGRTLSVEEAHETFEIMMSGDATPAQMGGLL
ncbi:MAG: anthranilate phosphoribosyltransferase, partial [Geminicoccaceae bacterium]